MNVAKSSVPLENLDLPDIENVLSKGSAAGGKSSKKLSVERIYQKKTQLEHILLRPDTYVGSVEHTTQVGIILFQYLVFILTGVLMSNFVDIRDVSNFESEFEIRRTSKVFETFEIRRMSTHFQCRIRISKQI